MSGGNNINNHILNVSGDKLKTALVEASEKTPEAVQDHLKSGFSGISGPDAHAFMVQVLDALPPVQDLHIPIEGLLNLSVLSLVLTLGYLGLDRVKDVSDSIGYAIEKKIISTVKKLANNNVIVKNAEDGTYRPEMKINHFDQKFRPSIYLLSKLHEKFNFAGEESDVLVEKKIEADKIAWNIKLFCNETDIKWVLFFSIVSGIFLAILVLLNMYEDTGLIPSVTLWFAFPVFAIELGVILGTVWFAIRSRKALKIGSHLDKIEEEFSAAVEELRTEMLQGIKNLNK